MTDVEAKNVPQDNKVDMSLFAKSFLLSLDEPMHQINERLSNLA